MADTAEAQLERVLYVLSAASFRGGATLEELAEALDVKPAQAARDATALADRVLYHRPGATAGADILIEHDRVQVLARGNTHRPMRLSAREAAALALGLLSMTQGASPERAAELRGLGRRLERFAARSKPLSASGRPLEQAPGALEAPTALLDVDNPGDLGVHECLRRGAAQRRACRIEYLKPMEQVPASRIIYPYVLVHAERWWYALGPDKQDEGIRFFRLDRIVSAELLEERFQPPAAFDVQTYLRNGRAFSTATEEQVVVRYTGGAVPYVREQYPEAEPDGASVVVRHLAADPDWIVRHALSYGADAEVLSPPAARARVALAAGALAARWGGGRT